MLYHRHQTEFCFNLTNLRQNISLCIKKTRLTSCVRVLKVPIDNILHAWLLVWCSGCVGLALCWHCPTPNFEPQNLEQTAFSTHNIVFELCQPKIEFACDLCLFSLLNAFTSKDVLSYCLPPALNVAFTMVKSWNINHQWHLEWCLIILFH